jgi:hypothetical protein
MSGLDDDGKAIVTQIINSVRDKAVVVLATNEKEEYGLGKLQCRLGQ